MIEVAVKLPQWLVTLRSREIIARVTNDLRSAEGMVLGVDFETARNEAIGGGQANFDESWGDLTPEDRVLLYAYCNQQGHLEELFEAFRQLFQNSEPPAEPVIIDLGCGPCTGGLAFASIQSEIPRFEYIGVDKSYAMRALGERLASATTQMDETRRHWTADIPSVKWHRAPGWRPVIVIVSYLLASPTLIPAKLVDELEGLLRSIGNGPVTVLYTNSNQPVANRNFTKFSNALARFGFELHAGDEGVIPIKRRSGITKRSLWYALFYRPSKKTLNLGG